MIRKKKWKKLTAYTPFKVTIKFCEDTGIFSKGIAEKAEYLREARNKIHLAGLTEVDEVYEKDEV